jgi:hypothetical protein
MSKKLLLLPLLLLGTSLFFVPSCTDENLCADVDCGTYGTCFDGDCVCDDGYEIGTSGQCDTEWSAKFIDSYTGADGCGGPLTKPVEITRLGVKQIRISNFGGFDSYVDAEVTESGGVANTFEITNFIDPAGRKFTGSGTLNGNSITSSYTVTYTDNTSETCSFNITK